MTNAESRAEAERIKRDHLVADIAAAGGRVADIADILGISRAAIYDAIGRAQQSQPQA